METKSGPGKSRHWNQYGTRLKNLGPLKQCLKCGKRYRTFDTKHWCRTADFGYCQGDLVVDEFRNAIELAHEKLEVTKKKLRLADKALKDLDDPLTRYPKDIDIARQKHTRKRDKLRWRLTEMGFDWTKLDEENDEKTY